MKRAFYYLILLCLVACIVTGGAVAQWVFTDTAEPQNTSNLLSISPFMYAPEEVLPDEEESAEMQENHIDLLHNILHHPKYGLNYSNTLDNAINLHDLLRSQENIQGGNLKHLFTTRESELLDFAIHYISDSEYVLYSFEDDDLAMGTVDSTRIPVYMVVLAEVDGKWDAAGAVKGHAVIREFTTSNNKTYRTINPDDFIAGSLSAYQS